jgi:hypothetical protein
MLKEANTTTWQMSLYTKKQTKTTILGDSIHAH